MDRIQTEDISTREGIAACRLWLISVIWDFIMNEENDNYSIELEVDNVEVKSLLKFRYELTDEIREMVEDSKEDFLKEISILKKSDNKCLRDLAEHYIGVGYLIRLMSNELSIVDAKTVGMQIIVSQSLVGNIYSEKAIDAYSELYSCKIPQTV